MQFDWLTVFWPTSQEQDFSQTQDLCRNTANNRHIHYRTNSVKPMSKFFFKFKKPIFGPFPQFWGQKEFFKKLGCQAKLHNGY